MDTHRVGAEVYTTDGEKLGTIKEFRDTYFKVDASMQPDYWLRTDCIRGGGAMGGSSSLGTQPAYSGGSARSDSENRVTVTFTKDHLDDYKVDLPS
jgi:hypothetical protein